MTEFNFQIIAENLGKSLEGMTKEVEREMKKAIRDVAYGAYGSIIANLQSKTVHPTKRKAYLDALKIVRITNGYVIFLESGWGEQIEDGEKSFSIKDAILRSKKVISVGSRAGQPFVRTSKTGKKYAAVPFGFQPHSQDPGLGDLDAEIKNFKARNMRNRKQKMTRIFRDLEGKPIHGRAAVIEPGQTDNPFFEGLTKYQSVSDTGRVKSFYAVFRIVHSDSSGWRYPGSRGYHLFKKAEVYVEEQMRDIVNTFV